MSIPPPRRALTPTTGVLTGAPVIGKIDRMRIGPSPRRAGAARSTDIVAVAGCRPSVGSRRSSSSASATSIDGSGPPTSASFAVARRSYEYGSCAFSFGENDTMPNRSFDDANAFHRGMRRFASTKVAGAVLRPIANPLDQLITKATGGRRSFAGILTGVPAVILTATGAKSGEPRTVALWGHPHPDGLALIASNFGGAKHPAWYHNLKANPEATVSSEGDTWQATARTATPRERDEIWAKGLEIYPGLTKYKARAGKRHIEAFILTRN
jgi:deazaflavin-dependent oxidoreductase (nitroreductase family)